MHVYCEAVPVPTEQVVTINRFTKQRTFEPFRRLPEKIRFMMKEVECDGETEYVSVPVAEIVLDPLNSDRETVSVADAVKLKVSYFDRDGNTLLSETIDLVPMYYPSRTTRFPLPSTPRRARVGDAPAR